MNAATPGMKIDAGELARRVEGTWLMPAGELTVTAVEIDSRLCTPGTLFAALAGQHTDGHDYIAAAGAAGAAAALVSRDPGTLPRPLPCPLLMVDDVEAALARLGAFGRAAHRMAGGHLVAITGSVGKTGSKEMLAHMLRRLGGCHANRASFNNHLGVPLTLAALPDAPLAAVQEIGMNAPGEIRTLSTLAQPDIAVITRIADSHAGFFDSLDDIAAAKAEIFDGLTAGGTAILNADDAYFTFLSSRASNAGAGRTIGFGTDASAEARLLDLMTDDAGTNVRADILGTGLAFRMGTRGQHWAHNAMAMLAAVAALDLDVKQAAESLNDFSEMPGRGAISSGVFDSTTIILIDDSYNAGPASMKAAFTMIAATPPQIIVLSDMLELGDAGAAAHAALAPAIAALHPRMLITIGPMMAEMASSLPGGIDHHAVDTPDLAIAALRAALRDDDRVFIKGSNGSGAWRVAAAILDGFSAPTGANGGASHAA
ncbi:MAG: UDP-N-acetylmuramoyl-tripeptide--D-alanyl-D-alanine ligase [SAR116 cluster bacterium]|nr:MAG: UDP-N-acetylmuramoyl-tripeptide--D-alanyl-D-alanine ligase [SAR116 cluster bacterium]